MGVDVAIGRKAVGLVPFHAHVLVFFHWWEGNHKQWKSCTVVPSTVQHTQTKTTQHKDRHSPPFSSSIMESARGSIESSKMLSFAYCTCPSPPPISLPPFPKIFLFLCIKQDFPTSRLATIPPPPSLSPIKEMSQMKIKRNSLSPSLHTKSVQFPRSIFRNRKIVRPFLH